MTLREAFENNLQKTYVTFHMLVVLRHFYFFPLKYQKYFNQFRVGEGGGHKGKILVICI